MKFPKVHIKEYTSFFLELAMPSPSISEEHRDQHASCKYCLDYVYYSNDPAKKTLRSTIPREKDQ